MIPINLKQNVDILNKRGKWGQAINFSRMSSGVQYYDNSDDIKVCFYLDGQIPLPMPHRKVKCLTIILLLQ